MALHLPHLPAPSTEDSSIPLSTIPIQPLTWLWPQHIPLGKLTLLDGAPGTGTSLLALTIAAAVTSGLPLPGSNDPSFPPVQGSVILISPHDHAGDTIRPRLEAAGGDASALFLLNSIPITEADPAASPPSLLPTLPVTRRPFSLVEDLDALEATIIRRHARLVIIDPLHTALAPSTRIPASRRPSRRALLFSLAQLARRTHCAFLLVRQVNTHSSTLRRPRPSTSPDLVATARSGLLLTTDPSDEQTSLLVPTKSPLCAPPPILAYQVSEYALGIPFIHWLPNWQPPVTASTSGHPMPDPAPSAQRQGIRECLLVSQVALGAREIAAKSGYNYENVRKMLRRLCQEGTLISPARGLYTFLGHPCLLQYDVEFETLVAQSEAAYVPDDLLDDDEKHTPHIPIVPTEQNDNNTHIPTEQSNNAHVPIVTTEQNVVCQGPCVSCKQESSPTCHPEHTTSHPEHPDCHPERSEGPLPPKHTCHPEHPTCHPERSEGSRHTQNDTTTIPIVPTENSPSSHDSPESASWQQP